MATILEQSFFPWKISYNHYIATVIEEKEEN